MKRRSSFKPDARPEVESAIFEMFESRPRIDADVRAAGMSEANIELWWLYVERMCARISFDLPARSGRGGLTREARFLRALAKKHSDVRDETRGRSPARDDAMVAEFVERVDARRAAYGATERAATLAIMTTHFEARFSWISSLTGEKKLTERDRLKAQELARGEYEMVRKAVKRHREKKDQTPE